MEQGSPNSRRSPISGHYSAELFPINARTSDLEKASPELPGRGKSDRAARVSHRIKELVSNSSNSDWKNLFGKHQAAR